MWIPYIVRKSTSLQFRELKLWFKIFCSYSISEVVKFKECIIVHLPIGPYCYNSKLQIVLKISLETWCLERFYCQILMLYFWFNLSWTFFRIRFFSGKITYTKKFLVRMLYKQNIVKKGRDKRSTIFRLVCFWNEIFSNAKSSLWSTGRTRRSLPIWWGWNIRSRRFNRKGACWKQRYVVLFWNEWGKLTNSLGLKQILIFLGVV